MHGQVNWTWLHVALFWIAAGERRRGLGSSLLRAIETAAIERGCTQAHLDTFSYQARPFYERHGYACSRRSRTIRPGISASFSGRCSAPPVLAELAERDAAGEIAAIYAEIRRLWAVPYVSSLQRHLAARPGWLEWVWAALHPVFADGRAQTAAWQAVALVDVPRLAPIARDALRVWGVDAAGEATIRAVCESFVRVSPVNLVLSGLLRRLLDGERPHAVERPHGRPAAALPGRRHRPCRRCPPSPTSARCRRPSAASCSRSGRRSAPSRSSRACTGCSRAGPPSSPIWRPRSGP